MVPYAGYLTGALGSAPVPPALIIAPEHAWTLVSGLLILCCAILWLVTGPLRGHASETSAPDPRRTRQDGSGDRSIRTSTRPRRRPVELATSHSSAR